MAFRRTVLVEGSDLGGQRGDREFSALEWRFAALCRQEGVIWVVGGEIGKSMPWGVVLPHCASTSLLPNSTAAVDGSDMGMDGPLDMDMDKNKARYTAIRHT